MASPLTVAIATRWIQSGTASAILEAIRAEAAERRLIAQRILPLAHTPIAEEGFHAWLELPGGWPRAEFVARLRSAGIGAVGSDAFAISAPPDAVRLGLGVPDSHEALAQALHAVAALVAESPSALRIVV